jgi:valyl-tRNA synthetase
MDSLHFNGSQFEGIMRYDARNAGEETLNKKVLYINTKEQYKMSLGLCSRSGDMLETSDYSSMVCTL